MGVLLRMSVPEEDAEEIAHDAVLEAVRVIALKNSVLLRSWSASFVPLPSIGVWIGLEKEFPKGGGGKVDSLDEPVGQDGPARIEKISLEEGNGSTRVVGYLTCASSVPRRVFVSEGIIAYSKILSRTMDSAGDCRKVWFKDRSYWNNDKTSFE